MEHREEEYAPATLFALATRATGEFIDAVEMDAIEVAGLELLPLATREALLRAPRSPAVFAALRHGVRLLE